MGLSHGIFPTLSSLSLDGIMVSTQWEFFYRIDTTALVSLIASHNLGMPRSANLPIFSRRFLSFADYEYRSSTLSHMYFSASILHGVYMCLIGKTLPPRVFSQSPSHMD